MENRRQFKITAEVYTGQRAKMATESFYETMVIDTPEAGANLAKAIEHYEKYGPYIPKKAQGITRDPEIMDKIMGVSPRILKSTSDARNIR